MSLFRAFGKKDGKEESPRPKSGFMAFINAATSPATSPAPSRHGDSSAEGVMVTGTCKTTNLGFGTAPVKDNKGVIVANLAVEGVVFEWNMDERHESEHVHVGDILLAIGPSPDKLDDLGRLEYTKAVGVIKKYARKGAPIALHFAQTALSPNESTNEKNRKSKMALSGMSILRAARGLVSKKKIRFQKDGFDLDLAYITPQLIAMGFPSEGAEGIYRNPMGEVQQFFNTYHPKAFKVYNLCQERKYPFSRFEELGGEVAEFPFEDHNPPPFNLLLPLCEDVHKFLSAGPDRVASLHCKAGKGRTGTAICTYLVFSQQCTAKGSLAVFGDMRTKNSKGVTIPSQRRYIYYFELFMQDQGYTGPERPLKPMDNPTPMKLTHLVLHTVPKFADGGCTPYVQIFGPSPESQMVYDYREATHGKMPGFYKKQTQHITMPLLVILQGDVKFQFYDAGRSGKDKTKICHFWINTFFTKFTSHTVLLEKSEVDKAFKDKHHRKFDKKFAIELFFEVPTPQELEELAAMQLVQGGPEPSRANQPEPSRNDHSEERGLSVFVNGKEYDEEHMPNAEDLATLFDKFLNRSKFSETGQARMKKLSPEAKWTLILQDRAVGGVRASMAIPKSNYVSPSPGKHTVSSSNHNGGLRLKPVQEKSQLHSSIMADPDEEDNEEEDNDDDDTWAEALHGFSMEDDDQYNYLSLKAGDLIRVTKQEEEWWYGHCNGTQGYFPASHVSVMAKH